MLRQGMGGGEGEETFPKHRDRILNWYPDLFVGIRTHWLYYCAFQKLTCRPRCCINGACVALLLHVLQDDGTVLCSCIAWYFSIWLASFGICLAYGSHSGLSFSASSMLGMFWSDSVDTALSAFSSFFKTAWKNSDTRRSHLSFCPHLHSQNLGTRETIRPKAL